MKRLFKLFAALTMALVMSLATLVGCSASCNASVGNNKNSSTPTTSNSSTNSSVAGNLNQKPTADAGQTVYTFTVIYPDGTPCEGVKIIYCTVENGVEKNCIPTTQKTDSQGKIYQALATGEYHIHVNPSMLPAGYTDGYDVSNAVATTPAHVTATETEATITLLAK